jgi:hypothetical protein
MSDLAPVEGIDWTKVPLSGWGEGTIWELESHSRERPSDGPFVEHEPTGYATFRCSCGEKVFGRVEEVARKAREHVNTKHPDWPEEWRP